MGLTVLDGDTYVNGTLTARSLIPSAASVGDNAVQAAAAIQATKLQHQHQPTLNLTDHGVDATAVRRVLHRVAGATATIVSFGALATTAAGSASNCVVDLKKNGSSILTGTITLDNTVTASTLETPVGYSSTALVQGDVLEAEIVSAAGANKPKGVAVALVLREDAQ